MVSVSTRWRNKWQSAKYYNWRLWIHTAHKGKEEFKKKFSGWKRRLGVQIYEKAAHEISTRDEFCTFGTFVADNVRKLKPVNQILAKR